jgi:serine/threonine protein kinase
MPLVEKSADRQSSPGPRAPDVFGIIGTTQCGSFHVERAVAEGGFAVVYRALHGAFRAPVALKCLKMPGSLNAEQRAEFLEKFRAEAELMFRLSASISEVVRPLHVDHFIAPDGRFVPFIALEWLDGEPLSAVIDRRSAQGKPPVSIRRAVELLSPIARALHRAHSFPGPEGPVAVVHCDVKPDNLFVIDQGGEPALKILDFGVAKARSLANSRAGGRTGSETNVFTPSYAAPRAVGSTEIRPDGPVDGRLRVRALAPRGHPRPPPIEGEMHVMLAAAIDEHRRPTPHTVGVDVPDRIERAFLAAVAVDPKERTQTIEAFWTDLERALGVAPSLGRGPSSLIGGTPLDLPADAPPKRKKNLESEPPPPNLELDLPGPTSSPRSPRAKGGGPTIDDREFDIPQAPAAPPPPPPKARPAPNAIASYTSIQLDNEPILVRRPGETVEAPSGNSLSGSRLAPRVAARRAARGEGEMLGVRPAGPLLPPWLHGPMFLGFLAVAVTAADLYSVNAFGQRLEVEGLKAWWAAIGLFGLAVVVGLWRALSR